MELPFTAQGRLEALKYIVPSMGIFQVFYEGYKSAKNFIKLDETGNTQIKFEDYRRDKKLQKDLVKCLWKLGFLTHPLLIKSPEPGSSIHYAGPLGMSSDPSEKYSTDENGKLRAGNNVYIIDSAAFPSLPSKNLTFTIMAHALRVAHRLTKVPL
jgi:choline dehydrogenase-like flavoprotein